MFRSAVVLASLVLVASACGKSSSPTSPSGSGAPSAPTVTTLSVTAGSRDLQVGESTTVTATATFSNGTKGPTTVSWETDNATVATVSEAGRVTAVGPGSATIIARTPNNVVGTVLVTVSPAGPRTRFGAGSHRVGTDIAPGRYFSNPRNGCYWERVSGFGGSLSEIIANDFVGYDPAQYIVDILPSDVGFESDTDCGTWDVTPLAGSSTTIRPGVWLVGSQVPPGTYVTNASPGCYWERLRDFQHQLRSIVSNEFVSNGGRIRVTIRPGDVGFQTDGDCGTWTLESSGASLAGVPDESGPSPAEIAVNFDRARRKKGLR
ncbi:MAG: Ig-like domain-containing protein [Acidobacteriota bacterium]|nr:MAG: hypothetical protein DIU54_10925 [Acidobacteriota bacterium]